MTSAQWSAVFNGIWNGLTVEETCRYLELDFALVQNKMTLEIRSFIIDVSMVAGARSELLKSY